MGFLSHYRAMRSLLVLPLIGLACNPASQPAADSSTQPPALTAVSSASQTESVLPAPEAIYDGPVLAGEIFERRLRQNLAGHVYNATRSQIAELSCPANVPAREGESFDCSFVLTNRMPGTVVVTLRDAEGTKAGVKLDFEELREWAARARPLQVTVDDKPTAMDYAIARTFGGETVQLTLSDVPINCDSLRAATYPAEGTIVEALLGRVLSRDGQARWGLAQVHSDMSLKIAPDGRGGVVRQDAKGVLVLLDVGWRTRGNEFINEPSRLVDVSGSVTAEACGVIPMDSKAKPREQSNLRVTVAGREFTIRGAVIVAEADGSYELVLSTQAKSCSRVVTYADVNLTLDLRDSPLRIAGIQLTGAAFRNVQLQGPRADSGIAGTEISTNGPLAGTGLAKLTLSATTEIFGYAVTVSGKVEALRCRR